MDPLTPLVPEAELHPSFRALIENPGFAPARAVFEDVAADFVDTDGNFVQQLQTRAFDARIWELFLFAFLRDNGAAFNRTHAQPDFNVALAGQEFCIEAVTANPGLATSRTDEGPRDPQYEMENVAPIRLGSPLWSKLQRRYWELPHVAGKPLVIAIQNFSEPGSVFRSSAPLWQYLYGHRTIWWVNDGGELHIEPIPVAEHQHGEKRIPSGFFSLPDAANISAVLFGNTGTVSKFNRMGLLQGYGGRAAPHMVRAGWRALHDPNCPEPGWFAYEVGSPDSPHEDWGQGLSIFHNPDALQPLLPHDILDVAYHFMEDGRLRSFLPDFHPFNSITLTLVPGED